MDVPSLRMLSLASLRPCGGKTIQLWPGDVGLLQRLPSLACVRLCLVHQDEEFATARTLREMDSRIIILQALCPMCGLTNIS